MAFLLRPPLPEESAAAADRLTSTAATAFAIGGLIWEEGREDWSAASTSPPRRQATAGPPHHHRRYRWVRRGRSQAIASPPLPETGQRQIALGASQRRDPGVSAVVIIAAGGILGAAYAPRAMRERGRGGGGK
ncbi:Os01g0891900 [Oryza sativa Japonica Group]|uniref:Os01g0891900 protein n=1 Tax=Oryza sativa subsp. japonica TaxID=39947 RepID=A0A0P0VBH0_ORYSJ|nr:Os01g0891900 [Oryza sativa Japonica Group]